MAGYLNGGGWKVHGRQGQRSTGMGYDKLHIAIDDHSRLVFVQVHPDERGTTCAAFLADAVAWFGDQGITVEAAMTDNALNYTRSAAFKTALAAANVDHVRIRAYRPQTNGKVERFNRTLVDEFAYARIFTSNTHRLQALPRWIRYYNTRRRSLGGYSRRSAMSHEGPR